MSYDDVSGCFDALEKQCQVAEYAVEYEIGEKAFFVLERVDDPTDGPLDGLLTTLGYVEKYKITNDKAQSEYEKSQDKTPKNSADFEKQIRDIVEKKTKTA